MAQMKEKIKIPKGYTKRERAAITQEVIDFIRYRTREQGRDKNGRLFKGYSKEYKESLDYKISNKKGKVNLTLSGELIDSIKRIDDRDGEITIGHDGRSKKLNGKAEGNIEGTYGDDNRKNKKPRDYLGISKAQLSKIIRNYPLEDRLERLKSLAIFEQSQEAAEEVIVDANEE